jgi:broad specificity phosphatase PhoE
MVKILWARHGENVANLTKTFSYRVFDGDLTERGKRQAAELAERLAASSGHDRVPRWRARRCAEPGKPRRSSAPGWDCRMLWNSMICGR